MAKALYICDIEGTIANLQHRMHHINTPDVPKDWDAFYAACDMDAPIRPVINTIVTLHWGGAEVWFWTGRRIEVMAETVTWLWRHVPIKVETHQLRMRPKGDHRNDNVLKQEWLNTMAPQDRSRLIAAFEDRQRVVDMWRANGVPCFQVAPGDF